MKSKITKYYYFPFVCAFIVTLFVLAGLFATMASLWRQETLPTEVQQSNVPLDEYQPSRHDSQNILLIGCEQQNQSPSFFMLLRLDAITNQCYVVSIPKETKATINVKTMTIAQHYEYGSNQYAQKAVENLFLIEVQHYIRMDAFAIQEIVDFFGGVEYHVPYDISTKTQRVFEGNQLLDGSRLAQILLHGNLELNTDLVCAFLKKNATATSWLKRENAAQMILEDCDSDYTSLDFTNLSQMAKYFFRSEQDKVVPVILEGEYFDGSEEFSPEIRSLEELQQLLS